MHTVARLAASKEISPAILFDPYVVAEIDALALLP